MPARGSSLARIVVDYFSMVHDDQIGHGLAVVAAVGLMCRGVRRVRYQTRVLCVCAASWSTVSFAPDYIHDN